MTAIVEVEIPEIPQEIQIEVLPQKEQIKRDVLIWVNEQRKEMGLKPIGSLPRGVIDNSQSCVLSRAIRHDWDGISVIVGLGTYTLLDSSARYIYFDMPEHITSFVEDFDHGRFPELVN